MTWVFVVVGALLVVAIALVAVGRATSELASAPPRSSYALEEAVQFVADRLSTDASSQLSYAEVDQLLGWHLDYLEDRGVASEGQPEVPTSGPLVADEDDALAYVLGRADAAGLEVADEHVAEVLAGDIAYLEAIGAIGAEVAPPIDPGGSGAGDVDR